MPMSRARPVPPISPPWARSRRRLAGRGPTPSSPRSSSTRSRRASSRMPTSRAARSRTATASSSPVKRSSSPPRGGMPALPLSPSQERRPLNGPAGAAYSLIDCEHRLRDHRPRCHGRQLHGGGVLVSPLRLEPGHTPGGPLGCHFPRDAQQRHRDDLDAPHRQQLHRRTDLQRRRTDSSKPSSTAGSRPAAAAATTAPRATSPAGKWPSSSPKAIVGPKGTVPVGGTVPSVGTYNCISGRNLPLQRRPADGRRLPIHPLRLLPGDSPPAAAAATTAPRATSPAGRWPSSSPRPWSVRAAPCP